MKLKPLLLIIPSVLVFCVLLFLDKPLEQPVYAPATKTKTESKSTEKKTDYIEMVLVVGKTGSLEKGGSEPIYHDADEESTVIGKLEYNCAVVESDEQLDADWVCVDLKSRGTGYVKAENVEIVPVAFGADDSVRNQLIQNSLKYMGLRFVRYGKSLEDGIDCSNFVQQIYGMNGIKIPQRPKAQRDSGNVIDKEKVQPGDIIYYDKANNGSGHVGLYLGNGFIINSSGHSGKTYPEGGVRIVRVLYPDRTSYQAVSYLDKESDAASTNASSESEKSTDNTENLEQMPQNANNK